MRPEHVKAIAVIAIGLALGYAAAGQLNDFLGIEFSPKDVPQEPGYAYTHPIEAPAPLEPVAAIALPPGALDDALYQHAAQALADALEMRTGERPALVEGTAAAPAGRQVRVGSIHVPECVRPALPTHESFAFLPVPGPGGAGSLAVVGGDRSGDAYGLHRLAALVQSGAGDDDLFGRARMLSPALPLRLVDLGAVGVPQDPARWDPANYSHHLRHFEDALLAGPPYVDQAHFAEAEQQFVEYVRRMIAYGNNGLVVSGFLEFVDFERLGDGQEIYPAGSAYRARHAALREHFGRLFEHADAMGMQVILYTDMLALTPPLQAYLESRFGSLDTENPALWEVYRLGLEELFEALPMVDGVMIRVGEAGSIYNLPGWDYSSALAVRSVDAVQAMLGALLQAAEAHDKTIIFRTWSVGVGQVGDMHTNPASYARLLDGLDSPHLVVSTKYVMGDFYSYLPFNPTLAQGRHARLVELQNRLEFEGFMAFPNYAAPLHQAALQALGEANPQLAGAWMWNQNGGPQQAGPMSLYPFAGFWLNIDANSYATARLAWEPEADPVGLAEEWVRLTFGNDPQAVGPLTEMLFLSRQAVLEGLYIGPFARQQVRGLGLELTPQMWLFEWDIVDGSNAALSAIYRAVGGDLDEAIAGGFEAVGRVEQMQALAAGIDPSRTTAPALLDTLAASLAYERDLFDTLAWYRAAFLRYYQWLETGERGAYTAWRAADQEYQQPRALHEARYGENLDFPAFNFFAAEAGMAHARRALPMAWLARLLLAATLGLLAAGSGPVARLLPAYPGRAGVQALSGALAAPFRSAPALPGSRADRVSAIVVPVVLVGLVFLAFSSFLSLQYILLTALLLGGFLGTLYLWNPAGRRSLPWLAALPAALLPPAMLLAASISLRGPGAFWFWFWADAPRRTAFVGLDMAAVAWMLAVLYGAQRYQLGQGRLAALGRLVGSAGISLALLGVVPAVLGLERMLSAVNDEMSVLPLGLSRILGITTHLDIPPDLPLYLIAAGGVLLAAGVLVTFLGGDLRRGGAR